MATLLVTLLLQFTFTVLGLVAFTQSVAGGYVCYRVCYCAEPKVMCNLTDQSSVPKLYSRNKYDSVEIYGNAELSEISIDSFSTKWGVSKLSIINTKISSLACAAFDGISGTVHTLRLVENGFTETPQCALGKFKKLRYLYINKCFIKSLKQREFSEMKSLNVLDLSWNMISNIDNVAFEDLKDLKRLNLRGNMLTSLKRQQFQSLGTPYLDMLDLSHNKIESISIDIFGDIKEHLFGLDLSYNRITQTSWKAMIGEFSVFPSLVTLNVSGNKLLEIDQTLHLVSGLTTFAAAGCMLSKFDLEEVSQIRSVNVSNNILDIAEVVFYNNYSECAEINKEEKTEPVCPSVSLDVSRNQINTLSIIVDYFSKVKNVSLYAEESGIGKVNVRVKTHPSNDSDSGHIALHLGGNRIKNPPTIYMDRSMNSSESAAVFTLDLKDNQIKTALGDYINVHLSDPEKIGLYNVLDSCDLQNHSILIRELDLSGNGIVDIPSASCLISQVEILKLSRNSIRGVDKFSLVGSSSQRGRTRVIDLRQNHIVTIGSQAFEGLPELEVVDLRQNALITLPEQTFLKKMDSFQRLALDDNPILCDCRLAWIPAYSNFKPNHAHYNRITGRCTSPASSSGFQLPCYTWRECVINGLTEEKEYDLAQMCEGDHFLVIQNFSLSLGSNNPRNVHVEWIKAGPALIYGYRISYKTKTSEAREVFVPATVSSTTLFYLTELDRFTICLTPVIRDGVVKTGQSSCDEITPGVHVIPSTIGLSLALAVVVVILIIIVVVFIKVRLRSNIPDKQSPYIRSQPQPPSCNTRRPGYDDVSREIYETAE